MAFTSFNNRLIFINTGEKINDAQPGRWEWDTNNPKYRDMELRDYLEFAWVGKYRKISKRLSPRTLYKRKSIL